MLFGKDELANDIRKLKPFKFTKDNEDEDGWESD